MKKPNILELKTLKKYSVRKQFVVEVSVEVYAESQYDAEQIAENKLNSQILANETLDFTFCDDYLDHYGNCQLMENMEIIDCYNYPLSNLFSTEIHDSSVTLLQCEEDEGSDDTDTIFTEEEDLIDYWNDYHKIDEDEED
jgi:hypothetical protein